MHLTLLYGIGILDADTRSAAVEECYHRDLNQEEPGQETDTWAPVYLEIDGLCDATEMFLEALRASGFTGKEKRFRELPLGLRVKA